MALYVGDTASEVFSTGVASETFTRTASYVDGVSTTFNPTFTDLGSGFYRYSYTIVADGEHEWAGTGSATGALTINFDVDETLTEDGFVVTNIVTYSAAPSALIGTPLPAIVNLIIIQGMDMVIPVRLEEIDGSLRDLTDCTAQLEVRQNYGTAQLLELSTSNGRIAVGSFGSGATAYNLELFIPKAVSTALTDWGIGVQDLEVTFDTGDVARVWEGSAMLSRESTT